MKGDHKIGGLVKEGAACRSPTYAGELTGHPA